MLCTVLIVDDDQILAEGLARLLRPNGFQFVLASSAKQAQLAMRQTYPDVVLMDLQLPDANGAELMVDLKSSYPETEFIIITGHGSIQSAAQSTRHGAADYLTKPFEPAEVEFAIRQVMQGRARAEEVKRLRDRDQSDAGRREPTGYASVEMRKTYAQAGRAAKKDGLILILGESGVGKDHLARWIHTRSHRCEGPFFTINCAALPRELAESELFGHEPGAFTGSRGRKRGLLELADAGTLMLDEVGDLDATLQSKLLTFLDTRSFVRVGGERSIQVKARIIAATNVDLAEQVEKGAFRQDLFYRLNVLPLRIPPLRDRLEDLPLLVNELLDRLAAELRLPARPSIDDDVMGELQSYHWPGNIRELRNVLERGLMLSPDGAIHLDDLHLQNANSSDWHVRIPFPNGRNIKDVMREATREIVVEALRRADSRQEAAKMLGLTRHTLAYQLRVLGLEKQ